MGAYAPLKSFPHWLKYLFNFRKPVFESFDCIDIIIEDKPLFLLTWRICNGYLVKLKSLKKSIVDAEGSAVIKLSPRQNKIIIEAKNFWRKTSLEIPLVKYRLDKKTADELITSFKPFNKHYLDNQAELNKQIIFTRKWITTIKKISASIRKHDIKVLNGCEINKTLIQFPHL